MSQELTKEQMRVMIAEACGWKWHYGYSITLMGKPKDGEYCRKGDVRFLRAPDAGLSVFASECTSDEDMALPISKTCHEHIPDFCADLNAMAQAAQYAGEHLFDADDWEQFGRELEAQHPTASLKDAQGKFYEDTYYQLASLVTGLSALNIATAFCRVLQTRKGE